MSFNLQDFEAEVKSIVTGGLAPDQIDARITALGKPLADKQAADEQTILAHETRLTNIEKAVKDVQGGVTDADAGLQAIADHLAGKDAPDEAAGDDAATTDEPAPANDASAA